MPSEEKKNHTVKYLKNLKMWIFMNSCSDMKNLCVCDLKGVVEKLMPMAVFTWLKLSWQNIWFKQTNSAKDSKRRPWNAILLKKLFSNNKYAG